MTAEHDTLPAQHADAMRLAEELRTEHNGIGGVYLFLGHDGHNTCELRDIDAKVIGVGESGRTLLEAIQRADRDRRARRFTKRNVIEGIARLAAERFALDAINCDGIFNTANFQRVVEEQCCFVPTPAECEEWLSTDAHIVRLAGGCHWMVIPIGYTRHKEGT